MRQAEDAAADYGDVCTEEAGLRPGWTLGHKTGPSGYWNGVTAATDDVGILFGPNGERIAITVFIADSTAPSADRNKIMARIAALSAFGTGDLRWTLSLSWLVQE